MEARKRAEKGFELHHLRGRRTSEGRVVVGGRQDQGEVEENLQRQRQRQKTQRTNSKATTRVRTWTHTQRTPVNKPIFRWKCRNALDVGLLTGGRCNIYFFHFFEKMSIIVNFVRFVTRFRDDFNFYPYYADSWTEHRRPARVAWGIIRWKTIDSRAEKSSYGNKTLYPTQQQQQQQQVRYHRDRLGPPSLNKSRSNTPNLLLADPIESKQYWKSQQCITERGGKIIVRALGDKCGYLRPALYISYMGVWSKGFSFYRRQNSKVSI